jgi:hypothetical protein
VKKEKEKGIRLATTLVEAEILSFLAALGHFFWWPPSCFCTISLELYTCIFQSCKSDDAFLIGKVKRKMMRGIREMCFGYFKAFHFVFVFLCAPLGSFLK